MAVSNFSIGERQGRRPAPGGPVVEVVIGADDDWPVGVVHVTVAAGGGMPAHAHGASATLLAPLAGTVRIVEDVSGHVVEVATGGVATILVGERVQLENIGEGEARLLVSCPRPTLRVRWTTGPRPKPDKRSAS